jgi:hypothetical protein
VTTPASEVTKWRLDPAGRIPPRLRWLKRAGGTEQPPSRRALPQNQIGPERDEHERYSGVECPRSGQDLDADDRSGDDTRDSPKEKLAGERAARLAFTPVPVHRKLGGLRDRRSNELL